jgi:hypothetical protein
MVIFDGSWQALLKTRTPAWGVHNYGTARQHEEEFHLEPAAAKLLQEVNAMEFPDKTMAGCESRCTTISGFVNSEFALRMAQTQKIEESGGDPRKGLP